MMGAAKKQFSLTHAALSTTFGMHQQERAKAPSILDEIMIPESICVIATGEFKPGLGVILRFKMSEKNDYYYPVFLDAKGTARVSRDDLLKSFDQIRNMFLMDFMDPRVVFSGTIESHVMSKSEIEGAIEEYKRYASVGKSIGYPLGYIDNLKCALIVNSLSNCIISVNETP